MKLSIPAGTTSKRIGIFIQDSSSTIGAGLAGLAFNSAGLTCYSWIDTDGNVGGTSQALQTATKGTWTTRGFVEKDATNLPGFYEFGIPDALLAAGVKWAIVMLKGATNMAPLPLEIEVTAVSNQDAVRGGMTALPNANAGANGGLPLGDASGRVDVGKLLGTAWLTPGTAGTPDVNVKLWNALATVALPLIPATPGRSLVVDAAGLADANVVKVGPTGAGTAQTAGDIMADTNDIQTRLPAALVGGRIDASVGAIAANAITAASINAAAFNGKGDWNIGKTGYALSAAGVQALWDALTAVLTTANSIGKLLVDNITGNAFTRLGAPSGASVSADIAAVKAETALIQAKTTNLPASPAAVGSAMTLTAGERNSVADALLDRDMSVGADNGSAVVRTPRQALRFNRNKWDIAAGTLTVRKEDDVTASWTATVTQTAGNPVSQVDPA